MRREESSRKKKRLDVKERKEKEKEKRREEIKQLKALKRKEIMDKLDKLKKIAGAQDLKVRLHKYNNAALGNRGHLLQ